MEHLINHQRSLVVPEQCLGTTTLDNRIFKAMTSEIWIQILKTKKTWFTFNFLTGLLGLRVSNRRAVRTLKKANIMYMPFRVNSVTGLPTQSYTQKNSRTKNQKRSFFLYLSWINLKKWDLMYSFIGEDLLWHFVFKDLPSLKIVRL